MKVEKAASAPDWILSARPLQEVAAATQITLTQQLDVLKNEVSAARAESMHEKKRNEVLQKSLREAHDKVKELEDNANKQSRILSEKDTELASIKQVRMALEQDLQQLKGGYQHLVERMEASEASHRKETVDFVNKLEAMNDLLENRDRMYSASNIAQELYNLRNRLQTYEEAEQGNAIKTMQLTLEELQSSNQQYLKTIKEKDDTIHQLRTEKAAADSDLGKVQGELDRLRQTIDRSREENTVAQLEDQTSGENDLTVDQLKTETEQARSAVHSLAEQLQQSFQVGHFFHHIIQQMVNGRQHLIETMDSTVLEQLNGMYPSTHLIELAENELETWEDTLAKVGQTVEELGQSFQQIMEDLGFRAEQDDDQTIDISAN